MSGRGLSELESGFGLGGYIPRGISGDCARPPVDAQDPDRSWMRLALLEAMNGIGRTSPNPSVGAVLVKDGRLLAKAATEAYGSLHAETKALALAKGQDLKGATCYVTLEPCGGQGKQGPCAEALVQAGIARVVVAATDPHAKAAGLGLKRLREAGVAVTLHCLEAEAKAWHFPFLAYETKRSPVVIGKWAQTLDGHLADDQDNSQWISGPRSRAYTHWLRQKYDAIMIGAQTVLRDKPRLTARDSAGPLARHPHKILFDPSGRLLAADDSLLTPLLDSVDAQNGPLVYWCTGPKIKAFPKVFESYKDRIIAMPTIDFNDWPAFFSSLSKDHEQRFGRPLQSVMAEGGSQLLTLLMRADQLDAAHIFVRAGFLGGTRNRIARLHAGDNPSLGIMQRHDYRLLASQQIDDDVVLECVREPFDFWAEGEAKA